MRELDTAIAVRRSTAMIVSENGSEFSSMTVLYWSQEPEVEWHYIAPGKPQQNAIIESFNVSMALRPLRIVVLHPESTARRVIFCKGAHNGRPFGRHKTTVVTAYRSVRRRRSKALAGRFEGTDCRGKP